MGEGIDIPSGFLSWLNRLRRYRIAIWVASVGLFLACGLHYCYVCRRAKKAWSAQSVADTSIVSYRGKIKQSRPIVTLDGFVILFPGAVLDKTYFQLGVAVKLSNMSAHREFMEKKVVCRKTVYETIHRVAETTAISFENVDQLKFEIKQALGAILTRGDIVGLYFTEFLVM